MSTIPQAPALPATPRPIISIGAGGIVRDAHQPAYRGAHFPVHGVFDRHRGRAEALAADFGIGEVYDSLEAAVTAAPAGCVFDVAVPATALVELIPQLPAGANVLIQKPLGEDLEAAQQLRTICQDRRLNAAVNFQLRFAPFIIAARHLVDSGAIGRLHSLDLRVTVKTPWDLWPFLRGIPRLEILYHSIHYVDLVRHFMGEPQGVYARTTRHPAYPCLAATRTGMIMDYGDEHTAAIVTTHGHDFGQRHQESYIRWEGTDGAIRAQMGVLMDYPAGADDVLEVCRGTGEGAQWEPIPLEGTWFPDAFLGTMASVMCHADDPETPLPTQVDDACETMAVVEAAYLSSASGATAIPRDE